MVGEDGGDLEVGKGATMDGGSPRTFLGAGQVEMVEKPLWWLCQSGEDVTSGVLMEKDIWDV